MKFLIAATLMCLALFGQSQAGSLLGLAVPVPHAVYGVPVLDNEIHIEETQPIVEDRNTVLNTHEGPKVSQPSIEYGAPADVANGIETVPFVDSLPLVNGLVNFGTPSETYGPPAKPTTPQPELPYLQPGLPSLPKAPVVPVVPKFSEEHVPVSNEYLSPVGGTSSDSLPLVNGLVNFGTPSETYGPPAKPTTPQPELPYLQPGLPSLPKAPVVPVVPEFIEEHVQVSNEYLPPVGGTPSDSLPLVNGLVNFGTPSETYGPPAKPTTPQPELPYLQPGLPPLPKAPVVPVVPEFSEEHVQVSNEYLPPVGGTPSVVEKYVPSTHEAPEGKPSEVYGPPATAEVVLPTIHAIPSLPEAPSTVAPAVTVESSKQYFYEPPAIAFPTQISHTPEVPLQPATPFVVAEGMPSEVYGPPAHEEHKPSELYGAPIAPVVIPELPAAPVTTFAADNGRPSEVYGLPAPSPPVVPAVPVAFATPVTVQPIIPEIKAVPAEAARQYFYEVPAKSFPTPVTLPLGNGILSHSGFVQNSATSSSSSSSLQVNNYEVPLTIQPNADSFIIEELKPIGPGFAIHSVAGNSENTSTGSFNQVSVVNHLVPHLSSFGTIVGHQQPVASPAPVPVPHGAYGVPNF